MNKEIILRILRKKIIFKKHYFFIAVSLSFIFQLIILMFFVAKYNINYLLNKYNTNSKEIKKKIRKINSSDLETKESNELLNENPNPPIKIKKSPRKIFKDKEDNLCIIKNFNESNSTINFDNIELNINEFYHKCYESFNDDNIFITLNFNTENSNKSSKIISDFDNNYKENNKTNSFCYFIKKYVPFINIFIFNDLNLYIIKLSLFLFWLNLLIFLNIIFDDNKFEKYDYKFWIFKQICVPILSIIILFLLDLLCFTDNNLQKVLNNKMKKKKFVKIYKIRFSIYYIFMFIFYILIMYFSHKRYKNDIDNFVYGNDQRKDAQYFGFEILYSIFIYLVILPIPYCLYKNININSFLYLNFELNYR